MADRPSRSPKRRILLEAGTGAAVLATVLLVVLLHLSMVSMPHRLPPASPTSPPTLAPTNLLSWKTVDVPPSLVNVRNLIDLAVAPSNADTAYICNNQANSLQIWVTHDRGLSWQATSPLPTSQSGDCYLVVDSAQPDVVVAADEYRPAGDVSPMDAYALDFFSADGGASWQTIRSNVGFGELATYHGMTYALAVDLRASRRTAHLVASSNLLSWSDVDTTITSSGDAVDSFWLNPTNGELAAEGTYLWDSRDGGRHWSQLPLSPVYGLHAQLVEQLPAAGQPWHLCDTQQINADLAHMYNVLSCSNDGGQQWTSRQALNITLHMTMFLKGAGKLVPSPQISTLYLIGLEADGTLLVQVDDASTATTTMPPGIYRLAPNSSAWQRIGRAPPPARAYLATFMSFASGALWLGGECASLVPSRLCYSVNTADGVYTTTYP